MAKRILSLSIEETEYPDIIESCIILDSNNKRKYVDEFEVPYQVEIITSTRENESMPDIIEIRGIKQLYQVIDKEDCLPDIGLLDYEDEELGIDIKSVTLRELYKIILEKVFN